jgi:molybdate transport system substrate-binding protein
MLREFRCLALIAAALLPAAAPGSAAEIRVLSANALNIAERNLGADFTKETGQQVNFTFGSPGKVEELLKAGERYDLVIMPAEAAAAREKDWRPGSRRPFARVGIGVAAREGTKLDLSTVESTRKTLLDAQSITIGDGATGGLSSINARKVLAKLGIADTIAPKLMPSPAGQDKIAKGEAEIGLFNVSEIPRAKGVVLAGPVPAAVQVYIDYDAAIPATSTAVEPALALLKFFTAASARPRWQAAGLELASE